MSCFFFFLELCNEGEDRRWEAVNGKDNEESWGTRTIFQFAKLWYMTNNKEFKTSQDGKDIASSIGQRKPHSLNGWKASRLQWVMEHNDMSQEWKTLLFSKEAQSKFQKPTQNVQEIANGLIWPCGAGVAVKASKGRIWTILSAIRIWREQLPFILLLEKSKFLMLYIWSSFSRLFDLRHCYLLSSWIYPPPSFLLLFEQLTNNLLWAFHCLQ